MSGPTSDLAQRDPLSFLDQAYPAAGDAIWLPDRHLCVADAEVARAVLVNGEGLYEEHSDFFHTRRGNFGPRSAQVQIGRSSRALLGAYLRARAGQLAGSVRAALAPTSEWPDAGNRLLYAHLSGALLAPGSPPSLRRIVDDVVERAVLAGARERHSLLSRGVFRFRVALELARAVGERRRRGAGEPADLLDVVVGAAGADAPEADLAEVFLSFVFAVVGSIGFTLGWSVYLLGTNPPRDAEPAWIVREALRLWPVAWFLARRPTRPHAVLGVAVTPRDHVVVCPYLVHRNPRYWDEPTRYRPERWASGEGARAFMPFGCGPHACTGAALSMQLAEDIVRVIVDGYTLTVRARDGRPQVGPALAPPRFTLALARKGGG